MLEPRKLLLRTWGLIAAGLLCAAGSIAQDASVLRADRIIDGRGSVLEEHDIVVRGDAIVRVEPRRGSPDGVHDLAGLTILPGLIDTHVHIGWHFDPDGRLHDDPDEPGEVAALYAAENAYRTLMAGITTVQSLGSPVDKYIRDAVARGTLPGPRILTSLRSVNVRTGAPDAIRAFVREQHVDGADVIKIFGSASIRDGGEPTLSQDQMDAACGEAKAVGLRAVVHAHGPESARRAVLAGCSTIEHGALLDNEVMSLMAERGVYFDPNTHLIFQNYFDNRSRYLGIGNYNDDGFRQMELAVPSVLNVFEQGLEIPGLAMVFGTDAVAGAHGNNVEELIYRVEVGGQDPHAAIVSATSLAASSLEIDERVGMIARNMTADLIAVEGNPLEDISALRRVRFVMKSGVVAKNER